MSERDRLIAVQDKTDQAARVAKENLEKVLHRGDKLDDLKDRAENLQQATSDFEVSSRRLSRKLCWQNIKLWIILLIVLIVILAVLIVALVVATRKK